MVLENFAIIKAVVLDVDGVLTNGMIQVNPAGEQLRSFNVKDGYAMQLAIKKGIHVFIITGAKCDGVLRRMESLGVKEIYLGVSDKLSVLDRLCKTYALSYAEVLYMGDDMPDYIPMQKVGIATCPADAVEEIKSISQYISPRVGGEGAVRDVIEKILKLQGIWDNDQNVKSI